MQVFQYTHAVEAPDVMRDGGSSASQSFEETAAAATQIVEVGMHSFGSTVKSSKPLLHLAGTGGWLVKDLSSDSVWLVLKL